MIDNSRSHVFCCCSVVLLCVFFIIVSSGCNFVMLFCSDLSFYFLIGKNYLFFIALHSQYINTYTVLQKKKWGAISITHTQGNCQLFLFILVARIFCLIMYYTIMAIMVLLEEYFISQFSVAFFLLLLLFLPKSGIAAREDCC